jgi:hypothetical protein
VGLPWRNTQFYIDPELAGRRGFSGVDGLADQPNEELPRVAQTTPKLHLARAYIMHDFALGDKQDFTASDANHLAGGRLATRYTVYIGRFSVTDFFDDNRYLHDPRPAVYGLGLDAQQERGIIPRMYAATPGLGRLSSTRGAGRCARRAPPSRARPMAHASTAECWLTGEILSKARWITRPTVTRAPFASCIRKSRPRRQLCRGNSPGLGHRHHTRHH